MPGGPSAQQRRIATRQHGGEVARLGARREMTDAIDATMLALQRAGHQALMYLPRRVPGAKQLLPRHHSVRATRHSRELHLRRFRRLRTHWVHK